MKRIIFTFILAIFCCIGVETAITAQDKLSLEGKVYIANYGTPLPDVQVEIRLDGKFLLQTKSDKKGDFKFEELKAQNYQLIAQLGGFRKNSIDITLEKGKPAYVNIGLKIGHFVDFDIIGSDGKILTNIDVSLIGGITKEIDGSPISDVKIVFVSLFSDDSPVEVKTNSKGEFSLHAVEGQFVIYAYKFGYKAQSDTITLGHPSYGFSKVFTLRRID